MAIGEKLASTMRGNARSAGEYFSDWQEARNYADDMKDEGRKNVRVAKYCDHINRNGEKVFGFVVRCDA